MALEVWANPDFEAREQKQTISVPGLMGRVTGLYRRAHPLALALEVFALAYPLFLQWTIDAIIVSGDRDLLTTLALGFGLLVLMQQAVGALRCWGILYISTALKVQWRANVFSPCCACRYSISRSATWATSSSALGRAIRSNAR